MTKTLNNFQKLLKEHKESIKRLDKISDEGQASADKRQMEFNNRGKNV